MIWNKKIEKNLVRLKPFLKYLLLREPSTNNCVRFCGSVGSGIHVAVQSMTHDHVLRVLYLSISLECKSKAESSN